MSNKSLAYRLGLYISGAVLLVFAVFIFYVSSFHIALTKKNAESEAFLVTSEIFKSVSNKVSLTQVIASQIVQQVDFYHKHDEIGSLLKEIMKEYDHLQSIQIKLDQPKNKNSIYIVTRVDSGLVYTESSQPVEYSINEDTLRHYLPDPDQPRWSEPFQSTYNGKNVSVYNQNFVQKNSRGNIQISGSVRCEMTLDYLQNLMNKMKIWSKGYAFLVSPKGIFMTYPIKEFVLKRNFKTTYTKKTFSNSTRLASFLNGNSGPIITYPPALNEAKACSFPFRISDERCKWLMVYTIPLSELNHDISRVLLRMGILLLILVGTIFILVFTIASKIMKPISKISNELHNFSIEFLDHHIKTKNEAVALRESLSILQERYAKHKLYEAEVTKRGTKFLADLALASEIQQSIIPPTGNYTLENSGISIYSVFRPAHFISGDLFDFFMIDKKKLLIAIGDVSGAGIPAALFMGIAHTYIRSFSSKNDAKEIVYQVNKQLCINNANQFFITLFLGILDVEKGILNYCNAGHNTTFLLSTEGKVKELGDQHGLPLGLYPDRNYQDTTISIDKGDSVILYTDGITERTNEAGEFYGTDNFYKLFDRMKGMSPEEISQTIMQSVDDFGSQVPQHDDLSLMVLKYS